MPSNKNLLGLWKVFLDFSLFIGGKECWDHKSHGLWVPTGRVFYFLSLSDFSLSFSLPKYTKIIKFIHRLSGVFKTTKPQHIVVGIC